MEKKHIFIACSLLEHEGSKVFDLIGTDANGKPLFRFELSPEVAKELSKKMEIQPIKVKKTWQEEESLEVENVTEEAGKQKSLGNTTLLAEVQDYNHELNN